MNRYPVIPKLFTVFIHEHNSAILALLYLCSSYLYSETYLPQVSKEVEEILKLMCTGSNKQQGLSTT